VPRYLLRVRDRIFGADFVKQVKATVSNRRSQRPYPLVASLHRAGDRHQECLDHVIVCSEAGLSRQLLKFARVTPRPRTRS